MKKILNIISIIGVAIIFILSFTLPQNPFEPCQLRSAEGIPIGMVFFMVGSFLYFIFITEITDKINNKTNTKSEKN